MSEPLAKCAVGMPILNAGPFLDQALESIRPQLGPEIRLIISDDGSTDGSGERAREFVASCPYAELIDGPRQGSWANFAHLLYVSEGYEFFMWASQDDFWSPDWIGSLLRLLRQNPEAAGAFGSCVPVDTDGKPIETQLARLGWMGFAACRSRVLRLAGFAVLHEALGTGNLMYSVFRRSCITPFLPQLSSKRCPLHFDYTMVWAILHSRRIVLRRRPNTNFFKRVHAGSHGASGAGSSPTRTPGCSAVARARDYLREGKLIYSWRSTAPSKWEQLLWLLKPFTFRLATLVSRPRSSEV